MEFTDAKHLYLNKFLFGMEIFFNQDEVNFAKLSTRKFLISIFSKLRDLLLQNDISSQTFNEL